MILRSLFASCALCCALPAAALLVRADRDDAEYLELGAHYPSSVPLNAPGGEGVLIAPRWVLTSARLAAALQAAKAPQRLELGARPVEVQSIHAHPDGVALLFLREPVESIEPAPIYRAADENGKGVLVVAHGLAGRIGEKPPSARPGDRQRRAGINTIDRVERATLALKVKGPDDASDLQGVPPADSHGGAAYVEASGRHHVAGIRLRAEGEWDVYARVSAAAEWIDATMFRVATDEAAKATAKVR